MFYDQIRGVLDASDNPLTWSSESDYPVLTALLEYEQATDWSPELFNGRPSTPDEFIDVQLGCYSNQFQIPTHLYDFGDDTLVIGQLMMLKGLFMARPEPQFVYKVPTDEPSVYDLYLLCHQPGWLAGVKTKVVET